MFNQDQLHSVESSAPAAPAPAPVMPSEGNDSAKTDNADIYYMPENFQKNNKVAGKNTNISGVWVLVVSIFFLLALGGGLYLYLLRPDLLNRLLGRSAPAPVESPTPATSTPSVPTPLEPAAPTRPSGLAKDVYLAFRSELELTDSVESYIAVFAKYATSAKITALEDQKSRLESAGGQTDILAALKGNPLPALDGTEDITETASDQQSILTIKKTNGRLSGRVVFLPEKGQWKLSEETWASLDGEAATPGGEFTTATDDDSDGLTNQEETALGTNPKVADSDGDKYSDLEEINNGYNPTGTGKLADDKSLGTYLNTTFNASLLYPVKWDRTVATTDDSIILTAPDQQFVQLLIQPNTKQEDILSWYKSTFNVETVPTAQLITSQTWDGVRTPDKLTTYVTNKDKTYIFVLTYNVGTGKVLNYQNVYELILRSFRLSA